MIEERIDRQSDQFVYGQQRQRTDETANWGPWIPFMRATTPLWYTEHPQQILARMRIVTPKRRAEDLAAVFDGLEGFYYAWGATPGDGTARSDEAVKWILGFISETMRTQNRSMKDLPRVLPAPVLQCFINALDSGRLDRKFGKLVLTDLMDRIKTSSEPSAEALLNSVLENPAYTAVDDHTLRQLVDAVLAAHKDQAKAAQSNPKLVQWLVGQVLKAAKGQASPVAVKTYLEQQIALQG